MSTVPDSNTQGMGRASERLFSQHENENTGPGQGKAEGSGKSVQDQIIIAPEIMRTILEHLNVRTLKKVRLVCKSWLLEAQSHMERRGIVGLIETSGSSDRTLEFMETLKNKIPALPQPFFSINVDFSYWIMLKGIQTKAPANIRDLIRLSKLKLCRQLAITRISTNGLLLKHTLYLIIQCSSSLEYLHLRAKDSDQAFRIPQGKEDVKFQKLQSLDVDATPSDLRFNVIERNRFPLLIGWIMKASPNIDSFKITGNAFFWLDQTNKTLVQVDLRNVTRLFLGGFQLNQEAAQHLISTPFSKLQNLSIDLVTGEAVPQMLLAIVTNAAGTLTKLKVSDGRVVHAVKAQFPVCSSVQQLSLGSFPHFTELVARCFPLLQDFQISVDSIQDELVLSTSPPLFGVKTLRLRDMMDERESFKLPTTFGSAFPALESLHIQESFLFQDSSIKLQVDPKLFNLLQRLKHLGLDRWRNRRPACAEYSWLVEVKGIETLTLSSFSLSQVMGIPAADMSSLKVLRFSWEKDCSDFKQLLELVKAVDRVEITNCCSVLMVMGSRCKDLLEKFFDAAPNAVCGCK